MKNILLYFVFVVYVLLIVFISLIAGTGPISFMINLIFFFGLTAVGIWVYRWVNIDESI